MKSETIEYLKEELAILESLTQYPTRFLVSLLVKKNGIKEITEKINSIKNQIYELETIPEKFNDLFSERGWIAHGCINFNILKSAIQKAELTNLNDAETLLFEYYSPNKIELNFFYSLPQFRRRIRLLDLALADYKEGRYHSVIPILLLTIDGVVNEILGKGFHSEKSDLLDVWDSITSIDESINKIKSIFKIGRYKINENPITMPYRNGILHGVDINFDNIEVAAKCWHFTFVILDWARNKLSENERKLKFTERTKKIPLHVSIQKYIELNKINKKISEWKRRTISSLELEILNKEGTSDNELPEYIAIEFCNYWKSKNYGKMSGFYDPETYDSKTIINRIRQQFQNHIINSSQIIAIHDEAPIITEVTVETRNQENIAIYFIIRLIYRAKDKGITTRNNKNGNWFIIGTRQAT